MPISTNMRGALFMVVSMAGFTVNDTFTKLVVETVPVGQVMLVRGLFASLLVCLVAWSQGAFSHLRHLAHPFVALRVICELTATTLFLSALAHMPLANISAVLQALPLAVTMGAALFLGETVGWRRWLAICVGFAGVLVIVRPGFEGFNAYSVLALLSVMFAAIRDLATRRLPPEIPSIFVSTITAIAVAGAGGVIMLAGDGWSPMTVTETTLLGFAAVVLLFGYQFVIMAMRIGDTSVVAPFRYTSLLWAILLGFVVFGEVPDTVMMAGSAIVVASGLYTLYRERVVGRQRPAAESTGPGMAPDGL